MALTPLLHVYFYPLLPPHSQPRALRHTSLSLTTPYHGQSGRAYFLRMGPGNDEIHHRPGVGRGAAHVLLGHVRSRWPPQRRLERGRLQPVERRVRLDGPRRARSVHAAVCGAQARDHHAEQQGLARVVGVLCIHPLGSPQRALRWAPVEILLPKDVVGVSPPLVVRLDGRLGDVPVAVPRQFAVANGAHEGRMAIAITRGV